MKQNEGHGEKRGVSPKRVLRQRFTRKHQDQKELIKRAKWGLAVAVSYKPGCLRCSPAMAAAVDGRLWSLDDIVRITEECQQRQTEENREHSYNPFGPALRH
jgi:hypothetical protein